MKNIKHIFLLALLYALIGSFILFLYIYKDRTEERGGNSAEARPVVNKTIYLTAKQYKIRKYVIEEMREAGISDKWAIIPFIESGYRTSAKSSVGAVGIFQFMPLTAEDMGLNANDRTDYKKSTKAGIKYIKWLKKHFNNDVNLVLASYNAGIGRVKKRIKKYNSRHHLNLNLPEETKEYIKRFHKYQNYNFKQREAKK